MKDTTDLYIEANPISPELTEEEWDAQNNQMMKDPDYIVYNLIPEKIKCSNKGCLYPMAIYPNAHHLTLGQAMSWQCYVCCHPEWMDGEIIDKPKALPYLKKGI